MTSQYVASNCETHSLIRPAQQKGNVKHGLRKSMNNVGYKRSTSQNDIQGVAVLTFCIVEVKGHRGNPEATVHVWLLASDGWVWIGWQIDSNTGGSVVSQLERERIYGSSPLAHAR